MDCLLSDSISNLYPLSSTELVYKMLQNTKDSEEHSESEQRSWANSLYQFIQLVHESVLDKLWLVAEFSLTGEKRIDAILFGSNKTTEKPLALIVELKQWEQLEPNVEKRHIEVNVSIGNHSEYRIHPIQQTTKYLRELKFHHSIVANNDIEVTAIQYLHNFIQDKSVFISGLEYADYAAAINQLFVKTDTEKLKEHLFNLFDDSISGESIAKTFLNGKYILTDVGFDGLNKVFHEKRDNAVMEFDQTEISKQIGQTISSFSKDPQNHAIIIQGDAGTGKTIIGIHLLYLAMRNGFPLENLVFTFAKSKMLMEVIKSEANLTSIPYLDKIDPNNYSFIVADESHRMADVSGTIKKLFRPNSRKKIVVFLQDDLQRVLPAEQGTVAKIEGSLAANKISYSKYQLSSQKRSGVQGNYVEKIKKLLFNKDISKDLAPNIHSFMVDTDRSLNEIDNLLKNYRKDNQSVRWFAPYDWKWISQNNPKLLDISIVDSIDKQEFKKQWNPFKRQYDWYKDHSSNSIDQVGSVYTAQGLDYDYLGFIWSDDLYWDTVSESWQYNTSVMKDNTFKKQMNKLLDDYPDLQRQVEQHILNIVLNQYYVLLTRAKKGAYVWFSNSDTKKHFLEVMKAGEENDE